MDDASTPSLAQPPSFGSLSTSLGKRLGGSADNLIALAAEAERKIKNEGERIKAEWQHTSSKLQASIHRMGFEDWPRTADSAKGRADAQSGEQRRSKIRRVRTFGDFRRGNRLQNSHEHEEGRGWDLAAAVNNTLSQQPLPGPGTPLFLAPGPLPLLRDQQVIQLR